MAAKKISPGLEQLLRDYNLLEEEHSSEANVSANTQSLPLDMISANPYQPRTAFDPEKLAEMATSIKAHGVFTPILVRPIGNKYQLIAGERRWRAARLAGLKQIPVVIVEISDAESLEIALIENIQRDNLNAIEEAKAYQAMISNLGYSQDMIARRVGKSRSHIANTIRLLTLPKSILENVVSGQLTMGQVKPLIGLKNNDVKKLADEIQTKKLNARQIEEEVRNIKKNITPEAWQEELTEKLLKVDIKITYLPSGVKLQGDINQIRDLLTKAIKK